MLRTAPQWTFLALIGSGLGCVSGSLGDGTPFNPQSAPCLDGEPCDDGNLCTDPDVCSQGQCQPGPATICDDGDGCTRNTCEVGMPVYFEITNTFRPSGGVTIATSPMMTVMTANQIGS